MRNTDRLDSSGVGRSKGFGFAEFISHQDALDVLRATNNNPEVFGPDRRPIVEFAIENSLILQRLEQRKTKNLQKVKTREPSNEVKITENKRKREQNRNRRTKRLKKGEDENGDNATETVHSNANSSNKLPQKLKDLQVERGLKTKQNKQPRKNKESKSSGVKSVNTNNNPIMVSAQTNSRGRKMKTKADKEEEKFNEIVEKYKSKLFGENTKQLKASRWFDA
jgi:nucleolar protein 4